MKKDMLRQRRFLGVLGTILPFLVIISRLITTGSLTTIQSISDCHYYNDYLLFEGIVFAVGVFLIFYQGYDIKDRWLSTAAGICAIVLVFSPCRLPGSVSYFSNVVEGYTSPDLIGRNIFGLPLKITLYVHDIAALGFFGFLITIITSQFTKGNKPFTKEKKLRNKIYISCGILMGIAVVLGGILWNFAGLRYGIFMGEAIGLLCFGIAWLIKGEVLFKDKV